MWFKKRKDKGSSRIKMMNKNVSDDYHDYEDFDDFDEFDAFEDYHDYDEYDEYDDYMRKKVRKIDDRDIELVLENEEAIADKIRNAPPLKKFVEIGKLMFSMIRDVTTGKYPETPWLTVATIALVLLYILNPFDFIPDFIPFVGYFDDLVILTIGLGWIETDLHNYLDWRIERLRWEEELEDEE